MLRVATLLWDANENSFSFSRCYDEKWVERLYDGFARNLTVPFEFVLFTDKPRQVERPITQIFMRSKPDYGACIEPYRLNEPMILVGLDTVIVGNIDHLASYCMSASMIAVPHDPYFFPKVCNGVALVPAGQRHIYDEWNGQNDMDWIRQQQYKVLDLLFKGHVVSYKAHVKGYGLRDARIVYFHGEEKPHECLHLPWVRKHWLGMEDGEELDSGFVPSDAAQIEAFCNTPDAELLANIETNASREIPWISEQPENDKAAVIVGGGPSLAKTINFVRAYAQAGHTIFALNNSAAYLKANGVTPDWQIIIDPRPQNIAFLKDKPAKGYILASQCHPSLFDFLYGEERVLGMHCVMDGMRERIPRGSTATLIGGGITSGLTALAAIHTLGYRVLHLHGYDSSDADDGAAHAYAQDENNPEKKRLDVLVAGKKFRASFAMFKQAEHFADFANMLADKGTIIHVHGSGLLPTIAHEMARNDEAVPMAVNS